MSFAGYFITITTIYKKKKKISYQQQRTKIVADAQKVVDNEH
jgi:hypothetical protein